MHETTVAPVHKQLMAVVYLIRPEAKKTNLAQIMLILSLKALQLFGSPTDYKPYLAVDVELVGTPSRVTIN